MRFGFLIPTHVSTQQSYDTFCESVQSLQSLYPTIPKVFFYNKDTSFDISQLDFIQRDPSIRLVTKRYCEGEMNVYKHFYEEHYFDLGILLHDSFVLKKPFENLETIKDINYIWYFTNHRLHWHTILEEKTEYNIKHNIITHDDLILHLVKQSYDPSHEFYKYFVETYPKKEEWVGCYGSLSIIRHDFLREVQEKTQFFNILPNIKDKRDRIAMESFLALVFQYTLGKIPTAYDGLYYDGIKNNDCETSLLRKKHYYR
jgi:hypothetical protein